jgi:hypothetical protein
MLYFFIDASPKRNLTNAVDQPENPAGHAQALSISSLVLAYEPTRAVGAINKAILSRPSIVNKKEFLSAFGIP